MSSRRASRRVGVLLAGLALLVTPEVRSQSTVVDDGAGRGTQPEEASDVWDAPEVSRSVGVTGGIVVFWPRVIPSSASGASHDLARQLQDRLRAMVAEAVPGRPIDVRPEPERVCPQAGCEAATVGVLLARRSGGCVAVALVSPPGTSPSRLLPWVGQVDLTQSSVPFREPPESYVTVTDFARCEDLLDHLASGAPRIEEAIEAAAR
jgi:hypothetical protein